MHCKQANERTNKRASTEACLRRSFIDMLMLTTNNSRLRTMAEWQDIFSAADLRFGTVRCVSAEGAALAILEAVWEGK